MTVIGPCVGSGNRS